MQAIKKPAIPILLLCAKVQGYNMRGMSTINQEQERTTQEGSRELSTTASASTFGTLLFSELCAQLPPNSNVLVSPLSVYQALALVQDGATIGSDNESELATLLGPQLVQDRANMLQKQSENNARSSDADVKLSIATSIWADNLKQTYIDDAKTTQSAEAKPLPTHYTTVDKWISDKTNGMIEQLLGDDKLDASVVALLVNAVYFKGAWSYEFDPDDTEEGDFFLSNDDDEDDESVATTTAEYMTAKRNIKYTRQSSALGGAQVLVLDYGKGGSSRELRGQRKPRNHRKRNYRERNYRKRNQRKPRNQRTPSRSSADPEFSAIFILPPSPGEASMNNVTYELNSHPISQILSEVQPVELRLKLPRFRLEMGPLSLKPHLMEMGMNAAFQECTSTSRKRSFRETNYCGKFDQMSTDEYLYVDDVYHGASMEMTEEGTEAAAATSVIMRTRSARPRTLEVAFNRPFVVIIWHQPTQTPVFIARVENPAFFF